MTVSKLFAKTWKHHWDKERFQKSRWASEVKKYYTNNIDFFLGEKEIGKLGPKEIREWHRGLSATPTSANRSLEILSRMFTFAEEEEIIPVGSNPCRVVKAFPERKRSRYATNEELVKIGKLLQEEMDDYPVEVIFCYWLAVTGARPESLQKVKCSQLAMTDDGRGVLIFQGKTYATTGSEEILIIPKNAVALLPRLPKRKDGLLFGPVAYRRFWERLREKAGCPDLWLRDLRRTFASVGLSEGVALDAIGELLNHKSVQTTKNYAKLLPVMRLETSKTVSGKISELLG